MEIYADPLVEKVFFNLLDNAARHGEGADTVTFSAFESDGTLTIVCEDNGAGIDREMREDLFRRGFGKNNGYGLYLIKEILSITGITIRESGETGRGARFEITVPKGCFRRGE